MRSIYARNRGERDVPERRHHGKAQELLICSFWEVTMSERRNEPDWKPLPPRESASPDTGQPLETPASDVEQTAKAVTRAVVSTAIAGTQVAAEVARGMAHGAMEAGREASGTAGDMVADITEAATAALNRVAGAMASAAKRTSDTLADRDAPPGEAAERNPGRGA